MDNGPNAFGRYNATQIVGNGTISDAPALSITPRYDATDLARSADRFILVNGSAQVIRYSKEQMAKSGLSQAIAPESTITLDASGTPVLTWLTADPEGNLYFSGSGNRVLKLAARMSPKRAATRWRQQ